MKQVLFPAVIAAALAQPVFADAGDRIEARLDHRGDRIEDRLDHRGDRINEKLDQPR